MCIRDRIICVRDRAKPDKKAWWPDFAAVRIFNNHIGISARARLGLGFPFGSVLRFFSGGILELLANLQARLPVPPSLLFHICLTDIMNFG